jgi:hypothetical protein
MKSMMMAVLVAMGFSGVAMADGFVCDTLDGHYTVKVYNQIDANRGTRNGAIMILSDNTIRYGRKTVATFASEQTLADSDGASYDANVDLRYSNSGRAGENILGTKLGQIDTIRLNVAFYYNAPVKSEAALDGQLIVIKRNGQNGKVEVACSRYLKH